VKKLIFVFAFLSCAAVNPYAHDESSSCPAPMSEEQHASGVVRCRALCSSEGRNFSSFDVDCKCRCERGFHGGYRP
jgi:hypothetical protein